MQRLKGMSVNEMLNSIARIEERIRLNLSDIQKILLTTDGSMTRTLEVLTGRPVMIITKVRTPINADNDLANELKIKVGEEANYRVVYLKDSDSDRALIFARSWTPVMRLSGVIKKDLTSTDMPIGKILAKHKLETRREVTSIELLEAEVMLKRAFKIDSELMLSRFYNIIHESKILIRINEVFPLSSFR
ncbi:MAG: chorismate pyruvate-lyase family protein [Candidatus Methylarchaceae archaeon HK02M1]|nr:chorismate pyruvate-lyase family protein [Candidatus Methylarchaceae archaeon HK02M1]